MGIGAAVALVARRVRRARMVAELRCMVLGGV